MPVTVTVEDGTGLADANSYASVADFKAYAGQVGFDFSTPSYSGDQIGAALIRATAWIDATYRARFPGIRAHGTAQALQWPRKAGHYEYGVIISDRYMTRVTDLEGAIIELDVVPAAVVVATCEAAWRELVKPGRLAPDLARGGAIRSIKAGSVGIEYATTAPAGTVFTLVERILAPVLTGGSENSGFTARAVRA